MESDTFINVVLLCSKEFVLLLNDLFLVLFLVASLLARHVVVNNPTYYCDGLLFRYDFRPIVRTGKSNNFHLI